ncbi:MAG: hypothetical protein FWG89_05445 [Treponema sp.]|nr:hypothetical protein [Treponema sp.]
MKKIIVLFCLCVCITAILPAQARAGGTMWVAVKTLDLKSSTGFFASTRARLDYGAQVTVLQINGAWAEIRSAANAANSGWVKTASLSARRVVPGDSASATASEVALAGKGFNQEIENSYRASGNLNYDAVDRLEEMQVSPDVLRIFLEEGRLRMGE